MSEAPQCQTIGGSSHSVFLRAPSLGVQTIYSDEFNMEEVLI
jgi:hypothetical protein